MTNGLDDQLQKVMSLSNQHRDKEVALRRKEEEEEEEEGRENGELLASFPSLPVFAFCLHSQ